MNKDTIDLLNQIAAKIGEVTPTMWAFLVRQSIITGITDLLLYVAVGAVFLVMFFFLLGKSKLPQDYNSDDPWKMDKPLFVITTAVCTLLGSVYVLIFLMTFDSTVSAILNPGYWALQHIINP